MKLVGSDVKFNWSRPFVCCDNVICKRFFFSVCGGTDDAV